jgi:hypothetical protein
MDTSNLIKFSTFCLVLTLAFSNCKKDEVVCIPPALKANLVGKWTASASFLGQSSSAEVEFRADGTMSDPDDFFIGGELNGQPSTEKTFEVAADQKAVTFKAASDSGWLSTDYEVKTVACDKVVLSFAGLADATLVRK